MLVDALATGMVVIGCVLGAGCDSDDTNVDFATTDGGIAAGAVVLSDAQSAQVVLTLNDGEVSVARSVAPRLTQPGVVDFASRMINEHSQSNLDAQALLAAQGIMPAASNLATALQQSALMLMQQLMSQTPVDQPYITSQVSTHIQALGLIDCVLIPAAQNTAWRDFITGSLRPAVADHLQLAGPLSGSQPLSTGTFDCQRLCSSTVLDATVHAVVCR